MLFRGCVFLALALIAGPATADTGSWTLAGRVLDAQGRPAAGVELSVDLERQRRHRRRSPQN